MFLEMLCFMSIYFLSVCLQMDLFFPIISKSVSKSAQSVDLFIDNVLHSAAPIYVNQRNTSFITKIFELLHIDIWGPYHTPTHDNYKCFLTVVDNFSRSTWTHLLRCKKQCPTSYQNIHFTD